MAVFRRRLANGFGCPARGLPSWPYSAAITNPSVPQLDPEHRVWLCVGDYYASEAIFRYGSYTRNGIVMGGSASFGIPASATRNVIGLAVDPAGFWWCPSTVFGARLYHGTYNTSSGEPSFGGYITLPESIQTVVVDPIRRLWWAVAVQGIYYGTYDANGVPSYVGTISMIRAGGLGIDPSRMLIWSGGGGGAGDIISGSYDATAAISWVGTLAVSPPVRATMAVDPVRQWLWWSYATDAIGVYAYDDTGAVEMIWDAPQADNKRIHASVDPNLAVIVASGMYDGTLLYAGNYCRS